jgi:hypothetical protein
MSFLSFRSITLPGTQVKGSQTSYLLILCLTYFTFATNLVSMCMKLEEKAKRPRVVTTLEVKLKSIVDFEAGK